MIVTETPRLLLRHFRADDLDDLVPILSNEAVMKYSATGPMSREQIETALTRWIDEYETEPLGMWAVIHREDGQLLGFCGHFITDVDGQLETDLAYRLAPEYWGRGFATEAARAARDYAFSQGVDRLIAVIDPENVASVQVARKIGMRHSMAWRQAGLPVQIFAVENPKNSPIGVCP